MKAEYKGKAPADPTPRAELVSVKSWRDELTTDDLTMIARSQEYAEFWQGIQNNDNRILIAKLAALLDGKHG